MKTESDWSNDILNITTEIHEKYPELAKFITEMPAVASEKNNLTVNTKHLEEYYLSLQELLKNYSDTHEEMTDAEKETEEEMKYEDDLLGDDLEENQGKQ